MLAGDYETLSNVLMLQGRTQPAADEARRAVTVARSVADDFPDDLPPGWPSRLPSRGRAR